MQSQTVSEFVMPKKAITPSNSNLDSCSAPLKVVCDRKKAGPSKGGQNFCAAGRKMTPNNLNGKKIHPRKHFLNVGTS